MHQQSDLSENDVDEACGKLFDGFPLIEKVIGKEH